MRVQERTLRDEGGFLVGGGCILRCTFRPHLKTIRRPRSLPGTIRYCFVPFPQRVCSSPIHGHSSAPNNDPSRQTALHGRAFHLFLSPLLFILQRCASTSTYSQTTTNLSPGTRASIVVNQRYIVSCVVFLASTTYTRSIRVIVYVRVIKYGCSRKL